VNSERYLSMLLNTFVLHLLATRLPLQTQYFMQDGARLHTTNVVLDFLHEIFDSRVVSNRFPDLFACGHIWPVNSPDLNPCDNLFGDSLRKRFFLKSRKH
jgi:hypothetical protein